jgi:hypothetical protein
MPRITDRRSSQRFELPLTLRLRKVEPPSDADQVSIGKCLNISSRGLLFTTTESLSDGQSVEAFVDWPILLDNRIRLSLVIKGQVVRVDSGRAAMRIERYEFKTAGLAGWP